MKIKIKNTTVTIRDLLDCGFPFYVDGDRKEIIFADDPEERNYE